MVDKLISELYKNCFTKLDIECGRCENIFSMSYSCYRAGERCPPCSSKIGIDKIKHSQEFVTQYIEQYGDKLLSQYDGVNEKLEILCGKCDKIFLCTFAAYKTAHVRCLCNSMSRGERMITHYLTKKDIKYEQQKTFDGCKKRISLRFDFYLVDYDVLIEFDGIQHFKLNALFGGVDYLKETTESDLIKNVFCMQNKKKLLRICYKDLNEIADILDKYLANKNNEYIEYSNLDKYSDLIVKTYENVAKNDEKNRLILEAPK